MSGALALSVLLAIGAPAGEEDRPYVEILQDLGAIDGPAEGNVGLPHWERFRLDLRVANRLPFEVQDLAVEVELVHATREESAIPGWKHAETFEDVVLEPTDETYLRLSWTLSDRRSSPRAEEIVYRVHIIGYRVHPPDLETSLKLLRSSAPSDQRAALGSYDLAKGHREERQAAARQLGLTLQALPPTPTAPDALRMLFAVQALGTLGADEHVAALLALPNRLDRAQWGRAVLELATRMVAASQPDEPRLQVLPSWARTQSALLQVRAEDALEEAVRDTLLRMGDAAVPGLLLGAQDGASPEVRARARRLLHALGRSTVRSQLALRDRDQRLKVVEAFGHIQTAEPVPALAELLRERDTKMRATAHAALLRIGEPAVGPLVDTLGERGDEPVMATLAALAERFEPAVIRAAASYGVERRPREPASEVVARLRERLAQARRSNLETELEQALSLGAGGDYVPAIARLNAVFEQDREVYMTRAPRIGRLYFERARRMFARGDYDAAIETARSGLSVFEAPEGQEVLLRAQVALLNGYTELGDLRRADEVLADTKDRTGRPDLEAARGRLLVKKAGAALADGNPGLARALVDKARLLGIESEALEQTHSTLLFTENLAVVVGMSLLVPALLLVLVLYVRHRLHHARIHRLARAIDEDPEHRRAA